MDEKKTQIFCAKAKIISKLVFLRYETLFPCIHPTLVQFLYYLHRHTKNELQFWHFLSKPNSFSFGKKLIEKFMRAKIPSSFLLN